MRRVDVKRELQHVSSRRMWTRCLAQGLAARERQASAGVGRAHCLGFRNVPPVDGDDTRAAPMCSDHHP
jgi:hypothetical protein